jgi:hypothetical protein
MRKRPVGVTILAVLFAVNAAFFLVLAALAVFSYESLRAVLHALSPSGAGPEAMHTAMGRLLPAYYLLMAGVTTALAVGFWRTMNWARLLILALTALSLVLMMTTEVRPLLANASPSGVLLFAVRLGLSGLVVWYLLHRPVREAFQPPQRTA